MGWNFFKLKKVKCPDGREVYVHRNVNDAFPLHVKESSTKMDALIEAAGQASAKLTAEHREKIGLVLAGLDRSNMSLQQTLRAYYNVYQTNPCQFGERYASNVEKAIAEEGNLRKMDMVLGLLGRLLDNNLSENAKSVIVDEMLSLATSKAVQMDIKDGFKEGQANIDGWDDQEQAIEGGSDES